VKFFEQAQLNFKKSNFFKAIELFELSLKQEPLSVEQKILSCESIQKINESLNRKDSESQLLLLGESYWNSDNFEKAAQIFHSLFQQSQEIYYLEKKFYALVEAGHVEEALLVAGNLISEFSARRLCDQIFMFLESNRSLLNKETVNTARLRALVLSGDRNGLNQEVLKWAEYSKPEKVALTQTLIELTSHNTKYWHGGGNIIDFIWSELVSENNDLFISKKWLSKLVMDYWLTQNITHEVITGTVTLSQKYGLSIVGHELAKFLGDEALADNFLMRMPREAMLGDNFDFAKDLLEEESVDEVSKIEKNIKFFISTKNKSEAIKQAYRLERLNPGNALVTELLPKSTSSKKLEGKEVVDSLLAEIGKYSHLEQENYDYESSFIAMVKFYSAEEIQKDFEDMAIGFNLLEIPKVSLEILNRVDIQALETRDEINFYYLKAETLMRMKSYYKVRDLVEDVLMAKPLLVEESIAFQYLRAEAYYNLSYSKIALAQYKKIKTLEENYRLTEERISKIEKDQ
jgi:hypothetical protein